MTATPQPDPATRPTRQLVGVSLKAYFGYRETLAWCRSVLAIANDHPATSSRRVDVVILPSAPLLEPVLRLCRESPLQVGAQDVSRFGPGPHTGEVTAAMLAEIGCRYALVGHAERRRSLGETDKVVADKAAMLARHGIRPIICVGEVDRSSDVAESAAFVVQQLERAVASIDPAYPVVIAYEPVWAIGATEPAPTQHIGTICAALHDRLRVRGSRDSVVIYGGSAGVGQWTKLEGAVDGIFLGRFAHDPRAVGQVLDEIVAGSRNVGSRHDEEMHPDRQADLGRASAVPTSRGRIKKES